MAASDSMMTPQLETLLDKVDSKFSLVTLAARRARSLQDYYSRDGMVSNKIIPPQVPSLRKPLSMGFEEIALDKIVRVSAEEMAERHAAEEAARADAEAAFADADALAAGVAEQSDGEPAAD
ncbi:MAG: DNA-directed RNA polymerase subunit omega [Acidimicrobiia bacterium]|jgi:DNA-directed RNA polymerase subunit omega|nr:DNA-directed RNA polymerase subunit omega [Actinomycetota bacterium]NDB05867.1 DNA-directed RNA polymerase subunit omega [Acidimicrobiia bacterium]NDA77965.1 DNA-directed RNA polymerase subunit omega [Actinomycetota bacterium]NDD96321.1 DNA-directed RNA polymerase subunit omega [Actinomycetota bacterium]NDE59926.1 DNA-directed RNA polymerase subunit omega [Acidimicrobiia bacterium]